MPVYHYQALNAEQHLVNGQIEAATLAQAAAQLDALGLTVQYIGPPPATPSQAIVETANAERDSHQRQSEREQTILREHMEQVLRQGKVLLPALHAYQAELPAGRRRRQLGDVIRVLEQENVNAAVAMLKTLPGYWIPLLSAATSSRNPGRVLREFLKESQRAEELARQWWMSLAYPVILLGLAAGVMTALNILVLPIFRDIFQGFDLNLPWLTRAVFAVSDWFTSGRGFVWLMATALAVAALWFALRLLPIGIRNWFGDRIGVLVGRSTTIARFAQFVADLLEAELSPPHALRLAGIATKSGPMRRAAWRIAADLEANRPFSPWRSRAILTSTIVRAVQLDVPNASRIRLLSEVSSCYAERARMRLSWTRGIIEPVAIVVIGLLVGATVLALFLPLVTLLNGLA